MLIVIASQTAIAQESVSQTELEKLPSLPDSYKSLEHSSRISWLNQQIEKSDNPTEIYRLKRELAFQYARKNKDDQLPPLCQTTPPQLFDHRYRLICLVNSTANNKAVIKQLIALHNDALESRNIRVAAESLDYVAWLQSVEGDIAQAFESYEQVLPLAEQADINLLTNVTLNLALMYVIHGDREYVQRGIQLKLDTLTRLKQLKIDKPELANYVDRTLPAIYFNLGIAYALHIYDYQKALYWFEKVPDDNEDLIESKLVFSSLSYLELNQRDKAESYLMRSLSTAASVEFHSDYLSCYQQIIQVKLSINNAIDQCQQLSEQTPLEVKQDLVKRMIESSNNGLKQAGYQTLYSLYINKLEPQLKQSSIKAASRAELRRLQQESRLKGELFDKEKALKEAEEDKVAIRTRLNITTVIIFTLILIVVFMQLQQKKKLAAQFEEMSLHDRLTGLNNRHYFEMNIGRELNILRRSQQEDSSQTLAFFLFDIDHFKNINDNYGHEVGDEVLKEFAFRIRQVIRDTDLLIRWGGEEFLLISRLQSKNEYHSIAERLRKTVNTNEFTFENQLKLDISCTVGAVLCPNVKTLERELQWSQLVNLADSALYLGKRKQRNCWVCIDSIQDPSLLDTIQDEDIELLAQKKQIELTSSFE
ncbi:tetratricopeptide repeat-containing diguanylate cyclase [Pleionea sediminis]|uniref:tetratricopeptide repeat-containing diguanylate cyclase n=1 Tax=Pleionea sediminis TaxID=2569479 RepID=UPI001184AE91|nr:GGDEF domain-containing protein [Pleionea sediminis]